MLFGMFAIFLIVMFIGRDRSQRDAVIWRGLAGAAAAFLVGYFAYVAVFINPLRSTDNPAVSAYVYHTLMHQVVLGLAVPDNDFAKQQGIEWNEPAVAKFAV